MGFHGVRDPAEGPMSTCRTQLRRLMTCCAVGTLFAASGSLGAQNHIPVGMRQLIGTVRDQSGAALEGVTVATPGTTVRTNARGMFEIHTGAIDTVTITFRRVGFEPIDALLTTRNGLWDTVLVQLESTAQRLSNVNVTEDRTRAALDMRNFDERRARGIGQFVTREEILERGSSRLSDVLRLKRGVHVVRGDRIRFSAYSGSRGSVCQPDIWLDGRRSQGMEINELVATTVEAIELYPYLSTVPVEFQALGANTTPCGTIVVWTRIPNSRKR